MEYTFGDSDDGLALGLHRRRMRYEVSPVTGCQLVDEDFLLILDLVLDHFREIDIPFYHKKSHQGVLRNLVVRKAGTTGEILVNLVTTSQRELTNLTELGEDLGELSLSGRLKGFLHTINDGKADTIRADSMRVIWGDDHITEVILGYPSAFQHFPSSRPIPMGQRSYLVPCGTLLNQDPVQSLTYTAAQAPLPRLSVHWRMKFLVLRLSPKR